MELPGTSDTPPLNDAGPWAKMLLSTEYTNWARGNRTSRLYVCGAPQSGKTTFAAAVAEKLSFDACRAPIGVSCLFLDPDSYPVDNVVPVAGDRLSRHSLLWTIFQQLKGPDQTNRACPEAMVDLRSMIKAKCASFRKTYIIIDGLDTCPEPSRLLLQEELEIFAECGWSVMLTTNSRLPLQTLEPLEYKCECGSDSYSWCVRYCADCSLKICDVCSKDRRCTSIGHTTWRLEDKASVLTSRSKALELTLGDDEVTTIVKNELNLRLANGDYDTDLRDRLLVQRELELVTTRIKGSSNGTFLICKALLDYLRDFQWAGYEEIMHVQARVSRPVEEVFDGLMRRIERQAPQQVTMALTILKLVSQTLPGTRMRFRALKNALQIACHSRAVSEHDLYIWCQGTIVLYDNFVTPFHNDFDIYLKENCDEAFQNIDTSLLELSTGLVMTLPSYGSWTAETTQDMNQRLNEQPLLFYALPNWGHLLRNSSAYRDITDLKILSPGPIIEEALLLLHSPVKLTVYLFAASTLEGGFDLLPGCHALHFCAWYGLTKFIDNLIAGSHAAVNFREPVYGLTPLMVAVRRGQTGFAARLIELGADATLANEEGRSVLQEAVNHDSAQTRYFDTTKLILSHWRSPVNTCTLEITPLHAAILGRNLGLLKFLIQHSSTDVNQQTYEGHTALMMAAALIDDSRTGEVEEKVELLLSCRDLRLDLRDKSGRTALHHAAQQPSRKLITQILSSSHCTSAIVDIQDSSGMTAAMILLRNDYGVGSNFAQGSEFAEGNEFMEGSDFAEGSDFEEGTDHEGGLGYKVSLDFEEGIDFDGDLGHEEHIDFEDSLGHEENLNDREDENAGGEVDKGEDIDGEEVLAVLRRMSEIGADFRCTDKSGRGLLYGIAISQYAAAIDFLHCEKGLSLNQKDSYGWCALHHACRTRSPGIVRCLLDLGASSMLRDDRGWSPYDIAKHHDPNNETGILDLLTPSDMQSCVSEVTTKVLPPAWACVQHSCEDFRQLCVSATDEFWLPEPLCGNLAIHCAVEKNNINLCELLLEHFDIDIVNAGGLTALFLAIDLHKTRKEYTEMIKFLLRRGASLKAGISGLDALQTARQKCLWDVAVLLVERGGLPLQCGTHIKPIFEAAASESNAVVIEKLRLLHQHPLRKYDGTRLISMVAKSNVSQDVKDSWDARELSALKDVWPVDG